MHTWKREVARRHAIRPDEAAAAAGPRRRRRIVAIVAAIGTAVALAVIGAGPALAMEDEGQVRNNEPQYNGAIGGIRATQVYSLRIPKSNNALVTVRGALGSNDGNGGVVDTWERVNMYNYQYGSIIQPNQLWEFIPEATNSGGTLSTGYGFLRSRQSGKCLQVMSASTDSVALVNQWDCGAAFTNELWTLSQGRLRVKHSGAVLGLNTATCQGSAPGGNGNSLYAKAIDAFCTVVPQKENYRFATNKVAVQGDLLVNAVTRDNAMYDCLLGYSKWTPEFVGEDVARMMSLDYGTSGGFIGYFYENLSTSDTGPTLDDSSGRIAYKFDIGRSASPLFQGVGQIAIVCGPNGA